MQLVANIIIAASTILLVGLGFALIYRVVRFFHFAHGVVFTSGPYAAFLLTTRLGLPLAISIPIAVVISAALGATMELAVYRPLRRKGSSPLVLLMASLGIYVLLQNTISLAFGDDTKSIRPNTISEGIRVFGAVITPVQLLTVAISIGLLAAMIVFFRQSIMGKALRAVANDPVLANISGIDSDRVIFWTFVIGSALAGIAGIMVAMDVDMTPNMGMNALMMAVVAVIVGGVGSMPGLILGAVLLSAAQQLSSWFLGSQWQEPMAFAVLLVFLLFRPQGFLGKRVKNASI
ncbi:MAG: branched-chain amino acid ABC transporter permease [Armatimonadetes bacterium]|nr:branched-chain amino acid ABC transporter permease [Armatimonadota bacterium]